MGDTEASPLRIKPVAVTLARVAAASTSGQSVTARAVIRNPSRRLSLMLSIAFEADDQQIPNSHASATWTVTAMRPNRLTGKKGQLHALVSGQNLPNGYELDSAIRELWVTAVCTVPLTAALAVIPGRWVLLCEWEPNQPAMCLDEIGRLFNDCGAAGPDTETTIP